MTTSASRNRMVRRIADTYLGSIRVAEEEAPFEDDSADEPLPTRPMFSSSARQKLFRAFGPRGIAFFDLYDALRQVAVGGLPPESGFVHEFRALSRIVARFLTTEPTKGKLADIASRLRPLFDRIDSGRASRAVFRTAAGLYATLVQEVASDRDVHLAPMSGGAPGWVAFKLMSAREEKLDELMRNDPEAFNVIQRSRSIVRQIDRSIEKEISDGGLIPSKKEILGRPVQTGKDPVSGDEYVFDTDGEMLSIPSFIEKRRKALESQEAARRVFPRNVADLRSLNDEELDAFTVGSMEYVALTDDKAKSGGLTRIYPAKRTVDGDLVVVDGRFKGIYIDDLVNRAGRMIEGVAFDVDPKNGVPVPMETRNPDGTPNVRSSREPYVTVGTKGSLYLRIPSGHGFTAARNALTALSKSIPSLQYVEGSRKSAFTFEPKDFATVREALGGLALSTAATKLLRDFFSGLAKHELAISSENLQLFDTDRIGGFKPGRRLYNKQKEAMAWLESRGHSGVVALDTGLGKTATTIASMQKIIRDGLIEENQQFLYVCPKALKGNLPKEIVAFVEDPETLLSRVKVMTYQEFTRAVKDDPNFADRYAAVFFDEAQALKNSKSGPGRAAMALRHPKKVLFTASPMEKSPMEVFNLVAITNNIDLNTREGAAQARAFRRRFAEEVGGKIIGIKNDPVTARDFRVWVKRNLYFADKRDVEEVVLPQLRSQTVAITMDPEVEARYREVAKSVEGVLAGMVAKYRDRDPSAKDPAIEAARVRLRKEFGILFELANAPQKAVPGASNPKMTHLVDILDERVGANRRTLVFTDSPDLAGETAEILSTRFPGHSVAECLAQSIREWKGGRVVQVYREAKYTDGKRTWPKSDWKVYVLDRIVSPDPDYIACVLTSTYAVGQNLQQFDTVVHLDRDAWNNEVMKQRTARAWRSGQQHSVEEYVLDAVYSDPANDRDETLDQIVAHLQRLESELFDQVIIESQSEALGKEWFGMKRLHSSFVELSRRMLELSMSPYAQRLGLHEVQEMAQKA